MKGTQHPRYNLIFRDTALLKAETNNKKNTNE